MKICIAQTAPIKGDISANIEVHTHFIEQALTLNANAIFFPELSLTGYEPNLAIELATTQNDYRLDIFQQLSDKYEILIGIGIPTIKASKIRISMIIFDSNKPIQTYSKQLLHSDELSYFESGHEQLIIKKEKMNIALAICYESLQLKHIENAFNLGATAYLASVAKSKKGIEKAFEHYPMISKQFAMPLFMANCVGFCDNFLSVGQSSVWSKEGELIGQLDNKTEGILIFDTDTEVVVKMIIDQQKRSNK